MIIKNKKKLKFLKLMELFLLKNSLNRQIMKKKAKREHRWWVKPHLKNGERDRASIYFNLLAFVEQEDKHTFRNYLRMLPENFQFLLTLVTPLIIKKYYIRKPISPGEQLAMTIRYLASGDSMVSISYQFRVGKASVSKIISHVCDAICTVLNQEFLKEPKTESEWKDVASNFERKWNFPHCIGAIDGKHVAIQCLPNSGSLCYNYKNFHSIVLMAVCDADYKFILTDVGATGRNSDGGIYRNSHISRGLASGQYKLPKADPITTNGTKLSYFLLGDAAFPLSLFLMRPFARTNITAEKMIFNYRLSRARRCIENAFGIMSSKWRIFRKPIIAQKSTVIKIINTCVLLHNFLITKESRFYNQPGLADIENDGNVIPGAWRNISNGALVSLGQMGTNNYSASANFQREYLTKYFLTPAGSVSWQWDKYI